MHFRSKKCHFKNVGKPNQIRSSTNFPQDKRALAGLLWLGKLGPRGRPASEGGLEVGVGRLRKGRGCLEGGSRPGVGHPGSKLRRMGKGAFGSGYTTSFCRQSRSAWVRLSATTWAPARLKATATARPIPARARERECLEGAPAASIPPSWAPADTFARPRHQSPAAHKALHPGGQAASTTTRLCLRGGGRQLPPSGRNAPSWPLSLPMAASLLANPGVALRRETPPSPAEHLALLIHLAPR